MRERFLAEYVSRGIDGQPMAWLSSVAYGSREECQAAGNAPSAFAGMARFNRVVCFREHDEFPAVALLPWPQTGTLMDQLEESNDHA